MWKICIFFITFAMFVAGCGDIGSKDNAQPAISKVVLATQGTLPAGRMLSGVEVTLNLPTGVTPKLTASGEVAEDVVKLSNNLRLYAPTYIPANGTSPGSLNFFFYNDKDGFGSGEFATITLNRAAYPVDFAAVSQSIGGGTMLTVFPDYVVTTYSLRYLSGAEVSSRDLTVTVSPEMI